ncbi:7981_t:CDS:1, partial [Funneliformis mosseae]
MEKNNKHVSDTENTSKRQKTNKKGGLKRDEVWEYFIVGDEKNDGHYSAT